MEISFYNNVSEKEKIGKTLKNKKSLTGFLKQATSVINPVITIEIENPTKYNYVYIPQFHRYYFINDMINIRNNIWEIHMHVDALSSFKSQIRRNRAIIDKSQDTQYSNDYFNDGTTFFHDSREYNEVASFQNGFDDIPHYILITAGGKWYVNISL